MKIRTVWPTKEIPGVWFRGLVPYGRNPQGNLYFERDTIYSYGNHFPIAKRVRNGKGDVAYLFNPNGYSNTIARHKSHVSHVIWGSCHFEVHPNSEPCRAIPEYQSRIDQETLSALRARSGVKWKVDKLRATLKEANRFAEFFSLDHKFRIKPDVKVKFEKLMILWGLRGEL
jgi:hypothetical protein